MHMTRKMMLGLVAAGGFLTVLAGPAAAVESTGEFTTGTGLISGGGLTEDVELEIGDGDHECGSSASITIDVVTGDGTPDYDTTATAFSLVSHATVDIGGGDKDYRLALALRPNPPIGPPFDQSGSIEGTAVEQTVNLSGTLQEVDGECDPVGSACNIFVNNLALAGGTYSGSAPDISGPVTGLDGDGTISTGACNAPFSNLHNADIEITDLGATFT